jgi:hypothetical protein
MLTFMGVGLTLWYDRRRERSTNILNFLKAAKRGNMRKLATIQIISDIQPIPGYDRVEYATVLGWHCIIKKDEFKVGDKCIYIEIDSLVPDNVEYFKFLERYKYRVRTIKMCGVMSQGLIVPMMLLKETDKLKEGSDVSDMLGIKKYEPEDDDTPVVKKRSALMIFLMKFKFVRRLVIGWDGGPKEKGAWPEGLPHTDEVRVQGVSYVFDAYKDVEFVVTEKIDGCLDSNTIIETEIGPQTIQQICEKRYSGKVRSFDVDKNAERWEPIVGHSIKKDNSDWYKITTDDGKNIIVTGDHYIWMKELHCWRQVRELMVGDEVETTEK